MGVPSKAVGTLESPTQEPRSVSCSLYPRSQAEDDPLAFVCTWLRGRVGGSQGTCPGSVGAGCQGRSGALGDMLSFASPSSRQIEGHPCWPGHQEPAASL